MTFYLILQERNLMKFLLMIHPSSPARISPRDIFCLLKWWIFWDVFLKTSSFLFKTDNFDLHLMLILVRAKHHHLLANYLTFHGNNITFKRGSRNKFLICPWAWFGRVEWLSGNAFEIHLNVLLIFMVIYHILNNIEQDKPNCTSTKFHNKYTYSWTDFLFRYTFS